jgi:hypothetical protein
LRQQQPATAAAQVVCKKGNGQAIDQGRPNPLKAIRQTHPTQIANGAAINAGLTQPETQSAEYQEQRQASSKAEQQHAETGWLQINAPRIKPRESSRRGLFSHALIIQVCAKISTLACLEILASGTMIEKCAGVVFQIQTRLTLMFL